MEGAKIIELESVREDERGAIFQFESRNSPKMLLVKRNKGTISGAHYHTGKAQLKNPETVVLLYGEAEFILKNLKTGEELKKVYKKPVMMKLDPYVYHEIRAISDIVLIDMNTIEADEDTIKGDKLKS